MKPGEKLYIALYSKGHSVIEIRRWLNAENIISRLVLHCGKKLIRNHWMGTLSLYSETISVTCRVEEQLKPYIHGLSVAIAQNCYVRIAMHIYVVQVVPCTACMHSEFYNMYAFITTIYKLSMHAHCMHASRSSYA